MILVIGLGSMGKRRIRNLQRLGERDIVGVDRREDRRTEAQARYGVTTLDDVDAALARGPEAVIISLPPDLHIPFALRAARRGIPFFMEASVTSDGGDELLAVMHDRDVIGFPSLTMRLFPGPKAVHAAVVDGAVGKPLLWTYHVGQWLPDWHPWEDIRDFYVSKRETGGAREIVAFELNWLVDTFGPVRDVEARVDHVSSLTADIDDLYMLQLRHHSGVYGQLVVDVVSRAAVRVLRLTGSDGTLVWDNEAGTVARFAASTKSWAIETLPTGTVEKGYLAAEEPYVDEMRMFLECVRSKRQPRYSVSDDLRHLKLLYEAEAAARAGARRSQP